MFKEGNLTLRVMYDHTYFPKMCWISEFNEYDTHYSQNIQCLLEKEGKVIMAHIISKKSVFVWFLFKNGSGVTKIVINYFRFFNNKEHASHPKSELPSLIITKFGLNYSYYALNKKTRNMTD